MCIVKLILLKTPPPVKLGSIIWCLFTVSNIQHSLQVFLDINKNNKKDTDDKFGRMYGYHGKVQWYYMEDLGNATRRNNNSLYVKERIVTIIGYYEYQFGI